ncbi:DUF3144 domain-containing protein [Shewanella cyperi]|uniref:DUF3144 domain-containing protein n=1 Tax=Shewanella cyperi TaxID=2814292 RepID=A0A974XMK3_9GAMM|nr:DUF3144 domain-containing protein [Shewanella cyperi]QSX31094.1 DUF3144 domain-containing protein [Shewanella cyperi]
MSDTDDTFYDRADEHIFLSNNQITKEIGRGKVSASTMYATARFNSWVAACSCSSQAEMVNDKAEMLDYFVTEYKKMLEENLDDYIENFNEYMAIEDKST